MSKQTMWEQKESDLNKAMQEKQAQINKLTADYANLQALHKDDLDALDRWRSGGWSFKETAPPQGHVIDKSALSGKP
jgi:hypothetical protein